MTNEAALVANTAGDAKSMRDVHFLGIQFSGSQQSQVIDAICELSRSPKHWYVVTPNVDHVVMLDRMNDDEVNRRFQEAYNAARLRLCDSRVISALARLKGIDLPVFSGSDLTAILMSDHFCSNTRVAIVGGTEVLLEKLESKFPLPEFVQHIPPMGILNKPDAIVEILDFLAETQAHYVLIAIGAPRSEIIAEMCGRDGRFGGISLCIGASIEFITGEKMRAPLWVQRLGMEWAHRLLTEPRRLWRRYLLEGPRVLMIFSRGGIRENLDSSI